MLFTLLVNLLIIAIWSGLTCILCKIIDVKHFDECKKRYQPKAWEDNGRWYSSVLKINKWKDLIPQYIANGGFSKEHFGLSNLDLSYINRFILETCRAEWAHSLYALVVIPMLLINELALGITLSALMIVFSFLTVSIQRYNRFRLQKIRRKLLKEKSRKSFRRCSEVLA